MLLEASVKATPGMGREGKRRKANGVQAMALIPAFQVILLSLDEQVRKAEIARDEAIDDEVLDDDEDRDDDGVSRFELIEQRTLVHRVLRQMRMDFALRNLEPFHPQREFLRSLRTKAGHCQTCGVGTARDYCSAACSDIAAETL